MKIELKSLVIGIVCGILLILVLGTATRSGIYQCTIANEVGTQQYLFAVLNTSTGNTRITYLNTGPGHLVVKSGILDSSGSAQW